MSNEKSYCCGCVRIVKPVGTVPRSALLLLYMGSSSSKQSSSSVRPSSDAATGDGTSSRSGDTESSSQRVSMSIATMKMKDVLIAMRREETQRK